jgi:hypothetical protein
MIQSRGLAGAALFASRRSLISSSRSLGYGLASSLLRQRQQQQLQQQQRFGQNSMYRSVSTTVMPDSENAVPVPSVSEEGHITTQSNEAILFFDSESLQFCCYISMLELTL